MGFSRGLILLRLDYHVFQAFIRPRFGKSHFITIRDLSVLNYRAYQASLRHQMDQASCSDLRITR